MATFDEVLPVVESLSAADRKRLLDHLSTAGTKAVSSPKSKSPKVVYHPGGRGAVPQRVVIRGKGKTS
jgi:hypothetical protein